jgi:hypothetical protein
MAGKNLKEMEQHLAVLNIIPALEHCIPSIIVLSKKATGTNLKKCKYCVELFDVLLNLKKNCKAKLCNDLYVLPLHRQHMMNIRKLKPESYVFVKK